MRKSVPFRLFLSFHLFIRLSFSLSLSASFDGKRLAPWMQVKGEKPTRRECESSGKILSSSCFIVMICWTAVALVHTITKSFPFIPMTYSILSWSTLDQKKKKSRFFLLFLGFSFQSFLLELVARARERERKRGARKRKFCVVETLKKALSFSLAWRLIAAAST